MPLRRDPPEDWAERAPQMSREDLKNYYRTGGRQLLRWEEETGVKFKRLPKSHGHSRTGGRRSDSFGSELMNKPWL